MMIGYDIYDCFTMEHFRLRQRMTLTTKIYCSRQYFEITCTIRRSCHDNFIHIRMYFKIIDLLSATFKDRQISK
jgi:hypothetical protein